jgi:hypothetical protein
MLVQLPADSTMARFAVSGSPIGDFSVYEDHADRDSHAIRRKLRRI